MNSIALTQSPDLLTTLEMMDMSEATAEQVCESLFNVGWRICVSQWRYSEDEAVFYQYGSAYKIAENTDSCPRSVSRTTYLGTGCFGNRIPDWKQATWEPNYPYHCENISDFLAELRIVSRGDRNWILNRLCEMSDTSIGR